MSRAPAFTLVELLVVIAILVVLLALLAPAMDQAIYQAELALCASRLDAIAGPVGTYALDFQRQYPHRTGLVRGHWWVLNQLCDEAYNDRPILQGYIPFNKVLNDPLAKPIDIEDARLDSRIDTPYALYFGWRYTVGGQPQRGARRLGDGFEIGRHRFNLLASDLDFNDGANNVWGNHPDSKGVTFSWSRQDVLSPGNGLTLYYTVTRWMSNTTRERGSVDQNYLYTDGSVIRFNSVDVDETESMAIVPISHEVPATYPPVTGWRTSLPDR